MKPPRVLAIDGPAGTGKTTSARETARLLGFAYIDSGALYRGIALAAHRRGIEEASDPRLPELLADLPLRAQADPKAFRVFLGDEEVTDELRSQETSSISSKIATHEGVRERVGLWLHRLAEERSVVVEGRDIGTAVFPDADLKVFMTASLEERSRRRALELESKGNTVDRVDLTRQIHERDTRDSGREIAPLTEASDALRVDTTSTTIPQQVAQILDGWADRFPPRYTIDYGLHRFFIRNVARFLWGLTVEGVENVPRAGGLLVVSNHKSYLDPLLIGAIMPRKIYYLAKRELFETPLLGAWVRRHYAIPIDREGFDRAAIESALGVVGRGDALLVFPEGTRILRPGLGEPREGIAWLATRSRVPVLPLHIKGSWSKEKGWFRRGGIRIRIGRPIHLPPVPSGKAGRLEFPKISARLMEGIAALAQPDNSG